MRSLASAAASLVLCLAMLTGCAANIGAPQTRAEFVKMVKPGGLFRSSEQKIVNRPFKTVVNDLREYADKCLDVRTTRAPNYAMKEAGGSTRYNPKFQMIGQNKAALSLQELYNDPKSHANSGAPPGGIFVMVAEMQPRGNQTQLDIYHLSRGRVADFLKDWAEGDKSRCPRLP